RKSQTENDLNDELRYHIDRQTEQNIRLGMSRDEAQQRALKSFGGVEQAKESSRDARGLQWIEELRQDLRYGARTLLKSPGSTCVVVLTFALEIGSNAALFPVVNGVLLNPLPYPEPDRIMTLHQSKPNFATGAIPFPNFLDWQRENKTFSA